MTGDLLLGFRVENYRSIRESQMITLTRSARNEDPDFDRPDVAPALAIFGPNASGKSNLLSALRLMFRLVENSATNDRGLPFEPFLLAAQAAPVTTFEIDFVADGVRHSYEFSYDGTRFHTEKLFSWPKGRQRVLFVRDSNDEDEYYFGDSLTGINQALAKATRSNALFLSTASLLNHETLAPLHQRFVDLITFVGTEPISNLLDDTLEAIQNNPPLLNRVAGLVRRADLGVLDIEIEEDEEAQRMKESARKMFESFKAAPQGFEVEFVSGERTLVPRLRHQGDNGGVTLPFGAESLGTRNFIALLGPVLKRLSTGGVLVVDEMDTSLHSRLVNELVRLFQKRASNSKQAQLVLSTHDVTVMMNSGDYDVLDRDQIWFTSKDEHGATKVKALASFTVRNSEAFSRAYLMDRFGALPRIRRDSLVSFLSNEDYETIDHVESGDQHGPNSTPS
jgi:uncharacterized protein